MKNPLKIKTLTIIIISIFTLNGCSLFSSSTSTTQKVTVDEKSRLIDYPNFTVKIPREWDVIEKKNFTTEVPAETVIVFRNNVKNQDFTGNVNILLNNLQDTRETLDYAKEVINKEATSLYNFKEKQRDLVKITIAGKPVDTYIIYFEGKKEPQSVLTQFTQTFAVKDKSAYIITGANSTKDSTNNISTVEQIIKNFAVK